MTSLPVDLELQTLTKSYGGEAVVQNVSLAIEKGEFIALLGPSGCGKSTTLRMIAGLVTPTSGRVLLSGRDITATKAEHRDIGMVFQSYALFPHMTVAGNVEFGLNCRRLPREEVRRRLASALETVGLSHLGARYPRALSGGQQQRVALARVLALDPSLLLFDEPLSNLDAKLRLQMREEIRRLQRKVGITALFVTHDQDEAMAIADRIVVMNGGRVEQIGTAEDIYDRPRSRFVAGFIGASNMIEGQIVPGREGAEFRSTRGLVIRVPGAEAAAKAVVALRPEKIDLLDPESGEGVPATVLQALQLGATTDYRVRLASGDEMSVLAIRRGDRRSWAEGEPTRVAWRDADVIVIADP